MNLSSRLWVILFLLLPALLLFGCSLPTRVQDIEITFDGESCQYDGPESIIEGEILIVLNNLTDHEFLHLHVFEFVLGKTWQDFVEHLDGPTSVPGPMSGTISLRPISIDGDFEFGTRRQERYNRNWKYIIEPGSFGIVCAAHLDVPRGVWLAAPLEVGPVSSE